MPRVQKRLDKDGVQQGVDRSKRESARSSDKGGRGGRIIQHSPTITIGQMRWIERGKGNAVLGRIDRYLKGYEYLIALDNDTYTIRKIRC